MKNFKPGMKVVFKRIDCINELMNYPKENETVTINSMSATRHDVCRLDEYPMSLDGVTPQSFHESCLFPIEERGISLTMHRAELSQLKPKEVLEETIKNKLMQWQ